MAGTPLRPPDHKRIKDTPPARAKSFPATPPTHPHPPPPHLTAWPPPPPLLTTSTPPPSHPAPPPPPPPELPANIANASPKQLGVLLSPALFLKRQLLVTPRLFLRPASSLKLRPVPSKLRHVCLKPRTVFARLKMKERRSLKQKRLAGSKVKGAARVKLSRRVRLRV